jgi:hypothetical protein
MKAMANHHTYSIEFKRQIAQDFMAGEMFHALIRRDDVSRNLVRASLKPERSMMCISGNLI